VKSLKIASVIALSSLLVACGGGGGGDAASTTDTTGGGGTAATAALVTSSVKGLDVALTFTGNALTAITPSAVTQAPAFSNVNSLSSFTLNDSYGDSTSQFAFSTSGVSSGNFYEGSANAAATVYSIGGTTWSYARFGIFKNAVGTNTQYTIRNTPFFITSVSSGATLTDATYATSGLAVGVMSTPTSKTGIKCSVSAAYTQSSQEAVLTLSNCTKEGDGAAVAVSGTIGLNPTGFTLNSFTINDGVALAASNVLSNGYKFGGPTGQELVGAATVSGSTGYFTFAFGAKK
jgi:hypothetical protein